VLAGQLDFSRKTQVVTNKHGCAKDKAGGEFLVVGVPNADDHREVSGEAGVSISRRTRANISYRSPCCMIRGKRSLICSRPSERRKHFCSTLPGAGSIPSHNQLQIDAVNDFGLLPVTKKPPAFSGELKTHPMKTPSIRRHRKQLLPKIVTPIKASRASRLTALSALSPLKSRWHSPHNVEDDVDLVDGNS
jgi:hypothetical protein